MSLTLRGILAGEISPLMPVILPDLGGKASAANPVASSFPVFMHLSLTRTISSLKTKHQAQQQEVT